MQFCQYYFILFTTSLASSVGTLALPVEDEFTIKLQPLSESAVSDLYAPEEFSSFSHVNSSSSSEAYIIAGIEANKHEFPGIVNLQVSTTAGIGFCTGNIINETWILTAAHCVWPLRSVNAVLVTAGDHYRSRQEGTEQRQEVFQVYVHPSYNPVTNVNDIALLELTWPLVPNLFVAITKLADSSYIQQGSPIIAGWGRISSEGLITDELRKANLNFVSNAECSAAYVNVAHAHIVGTSICATGYAKGPCNGDSGGPLLCSSVIDGPFLCGLTSYGVRGCNPRFPNVFTRISSYVDWIRGHGIVVSTSTPQGTTTSKSVVLVSNGAGNNLNSIYLYFAIWSLYTSGV